MPHGLPSSAMLTSNGALTPVATGLAAAASSGPGSMLGTMGYGETNYDFFDPQHWMLDNLLDFTYNTYAQPLEGA